MLASDPVGATWGQGVRRAPNTTSWGFGPDAAKKIRAPMLMVAGIHDKQVDPKRVHELYEDLASEQKVLLDLGCSSHNAMWERNHLDLVPRVARVAHERHRARNEDRHREARLLIRARVRARTSRRLRPWARQRQPAGQPVGAGRGARVQLQPSLGRRISLTSDSTFIAGSRIALPVMTTWSPAFSVSAAMPAARAARG